MQVLSKVEASLDFNQVLLRPEAKNFTEVAALACRGEISIQISVLKNLFSIYLILFKCKCIQPKCP